FERIDVPLAREMYMATLSMALTASDLAREVDVVSAAKAIGAAASPPAGRERPHDLLLDGLAMNTTDGPTASAPTLRRALEGFHTIELGPEESSWYLNACAAATLLWDHESFLGLATRQVEGARRLGALRMVEMGVATLAVAHIFAGELSKAAS